MGPHPQEKMEDGRVRSRNIFWKVLKFGTGVPIVDSEVSNFMKIEMNFPTVAPDHSSAQSRATRLDSSPVWTSFDRRPSLEMSLAEVPDVRASAVARGRALIADPNYPSKAQLKKIARALVASGLGR